MEGQIRVDSGGFPDPGIRIPQPSGKLTTLSGSGGGERGQEEAAEEDEEVNAYGCIMLTLPDDTGPYPPASPAPGPAAGSPDASSPSVAPGGLMALACSAVCPRSHTTFGSPQYTWRCLKWRLFCRSTSCLGLFTGPYTWSTFS